MPLASAGLLGGSGTPHDFQDEAGEVALILGKGGIFEVGVDNEIIWSRKEAGRFPEMKELKQLVRDQIAPGRNLNHPGLVPLF